MYYDDRAAQLRELAFVDEADSYEVDQTGIYVDENGTFVLLTASGCSCWEGDYDEEQFESLDALENALINGDRTYNPSLNGARQLVAEARNRLRLSFMTDLLKSPVLEPQQFTSLVKTVFDTPSPSLHFLPRTPFVECSERDVVGMPNIPNYKMGSQVGTGMIQRIRENRKQDQQFLNDWIRNLADRMVRGLHTRLETMVCCAMIGEINISGDGALSPAASAPQPVASTTAPSTVASPTAVTGRLPYAEVVDRVRQYLSGSSLRGTNPTLKQIQSAIKRGNKSTGWTVTELAPIQQGILAGTI